MSAAKHQKQISDFINDEHNKLVNFVKKRINDSADRDAEDVVQETALNLFNKPDITLPIENISAYIYQALKNKIIDIFRQNKNELSLNSIISNDNDLTLLDILHDKRYNTETEFEKKELYNELYKAIDSLKPKYRAIIIATEFEDTSFQELSDRWDVPIGTLLSQKSRALKKIQTKLKNLKKIFTEV